MRCVTVAGVFHLIGYCVTLNEGEVTVEAGLCVVIPCSYRTGDGFTPKHIAWYKCEVSEPRCGNPIMIFHTNNSIKYGFEGRVSLLEPDIRQNNCSIIINDLKESDSGLYRIRVNGERKWREDGFASIQKTTIPTLTEGQQATLTCTAPGTESYITGSSTSFRTKTLTAFTQRHISTLTFNSSAEHHNTNVTCKIRFTGEKTTEEGSTLKVNYVKEVNITGGTNVKEGETLNLICSVESFPPSLIMWSKLGSDITLFHVSFSVCLSLNVKSACLFSNSCFLFYCESLCLMLVCAAWFPRLVNPDLSQLCLPPVAHSLITTLCILALCFPVLSVVSYPQTLPVWSCLVFWFGLCFCFCLVCLCLCLCLCFMPAIKAVVLVTFRLGVLHLDPHFRLPAHRALTESEYFIDPWGKLFIYYIYLCVFGCVCVFACVLFCLRAARVKHCGSYSTVLPWIVAGVSLTLNAFCITYIWFLWYVSPHVCLCFCLTL
uniref:Immunoglobulin domain-containing protein n=1 Tax=Maylandia zebra TaxID=106582 RepID=A0A3P9BN32_9CICH